MNDSVVSPSVWSGLVSGQDVGDSEQSGLAGLVELQQARSASLSVACWHSPSMTPQLHQAVIVA